MPKLPHNPRHVLTLEESFETRIPLDALAGVALSDEAASAEAATRIEELAELAGAVKLREDPRYVLILEQPFVVRTVLDALSKAAKSEGPTAAETAASLKEFAEQGGEGLILNVRLVEDGLEGASSGVGNVRASRVGKVLIVNCRAKEAWMDRVDDLRRHFLRKYPIFLACS